MGDLAENIKLLLLEILELTKELFNAFRAIGFWIFF